MAWPCRLAWGAHAVFLPARTFFVRFDPVSLFFMPLAPLNLLPTKVNKTSKNPKDYLIKQEKS